MGNAGSVSVSAVIREFDSVRLGDERLHRRLRAVMSRLSAAPGESFPDALQADAEIEGFYRFVGNERVSYGALVQAHTDQTVRRASGQGTVRAIHDTTLLAFGGEGGRRGLGPLHGHKTHGFLAHATLAVATDVIQQPLGLLGLECWARPARARRASGKKKKRSGHDCAQMTDKESDRWLRQVEVAEQAVGDQASLVHLMDREGDAYPLLSAMTERGYRYVVRVARDRSVLEVDDEGEALEEESAMLLSEALVGIPVQCTRQVKLSARPSSPQPQRARTHPERGERTVTLSLSAQRIALRRPRYLPELPEVLEVNVVYVREIAPPEGEDPIAWVLFTQEPIETPAQIEAVVDHYRARWLIEEFFKALKTGCAIETRQLESFQTLTNALALAVPLAWQMLLLRALSRDDPSAPAEKALTPVQLALLRERQPKKLPAEGATVRDAFYAVAGLGGHIKQNGPPGWITLARGLRKLRTLEMGWDAAVRMMGKSQGKM